MWTFAVSLAPCAGAGAKKRPSFWDLVLKIKIEFLNRSVYFFHTFNKDLLNVFYVQGTMLDTQVLRQHDIMEIVHAIRSRFLSLPYSCGFGQIT